MSNETRKLPTRPGWWWYHDPSSPHGVCVYVGKSPISGQMILDTTGGIVAADEVDGEWLAPVPGPAMCTALARYSDLRRRFESEPAAALDTWKEAMGLGVLHSAIRSERAERDGAA